MTAEFDILRITYLYHVLNKQKRVVLGKKTGFPEKAVEQWRNKVDGCSARVRDNQHDIYTVGKEHSENGGPRLPKTEGGRGEVNWWFVVDRLSFTD